MTKAKYETGARPQPRRRSPTAAKKDPVLGFEFNELCLMIYLFIYLVVLLGSEIYSVLVFLAVIFSSCFLVLSSLLLF